MVARNAVHFARGGARTRATDSRMRVVEAAYDELGSRFGEWMVKIDGEPLDRFLGRLVASFDEGVRWDAETNESLVRAAGLEVLVTEIIGVREPESEYETAFLWVLARKPE